MGNQLTRDLMLVYLDRGEWPEAVALVLRPKGKHRVPSRRSLRSGCGLSSCRLTWRVVELWTVAGNCEHEGTFPIRFTAKDLRRTA